MKTKNLKSLLVFFLIIITIQLIGSWITMPAVKGWYTTIEKPSFNPPNWVFGPVWTSLYIMIAISGWIVWNKLKGSTAQKLRTRVIKTYAWQLAANLIWSFLFFGLNNPLFGFLDILILLGLIILTIFRFAQVSKLAAWLLVPYLLWVSYATALNYFIVVLN